MTITMHPERHGLARPRSPGRILVAIVFALLALNAWAQVATLPFGRSADPPLLVVLQAVVGVLAAAAAWGSWRAARWAPAAAVLYGVVTGGMIASLRPILHLEPAAQGGLWAGAAVVLLLSLALAWYLRRATAHGPPMRGAAAATVAHSGDPATEDRR